MLSFDAETAMLYVEVLCPNARAVMADRWAESVWMGEGVCWVEKDRRSEIDQTWMLLSALPESRKVDVGSTARAVTV